MQKLGEGDAVQFIGTSHDDRYKNGAIGYIENIYLSTALVVFDPPAVELIAAVPLEELRRVPWQTRSPKTVAS